MNDSDKPAFLKPYHNQDSSLGCNSCSCLSKREFFAIKALQGLLSNPFDATSEWIVKASVQYADALLAELRENKQLKTLSEIYEMLGNPEQDFDRGIQQALKEDES